MIKNKHTIALGIASLVCMCAFGVLIARLVYFAPTDESGLSKNSLQNLSSQVSKKSAESHPSRISSKARLRIDTLNIDARIQDIGISKKGKMATPGNFFDVGLYQYGPIPGQKGTAVIDGHVDNGLGLKAVFGNLGDIKKGDDIIVDMGTSSVVHFKVVSTELYDFNAPAGTVFAQGDGSYLKLITCSGTWMPELRTHDKRLVVTAIKVES